MYKENTSYFKKMITDKLENIRFYKFIPESALDFIEKLSAGSLDLGKHIIDENVFANVETYQTKSVEDGKFESHNQYIDIQILLKGEEYIYYTPKKYLEIKEKYNPDRDIEFYSNNIGTYPKIKLDGTNFVILYPHEAHAPQICCEKSDMVLKVVVKVKAELS